jgi:hypothetical protein
LARHTHSSPSVPYKDAASCLLLQNLYDVKFIVVLIQICLIQSGTIDLTTLLIYAIFILIWH